MTGQQLRAALVVGACLAATSAVCAQAATAELTLRSDITMAGVGPVRIGMTAAQAERAGGHSVKVGFEVSPGCRHDTFAPVSYGLGSLTHNGRIAVLFITNRGLATDRGVRVGDTVADLRRAYGAGARRRTGFYGSPYFAVIAGNRQIHFGLRGARITASTRIATISTGRKPEVLWPEGCA